MNADTSNCAMPGPLFGLDKVRTSYRGKRSNCKGFAGDRSFATQSCDVDFSPKRTCLLQSPCRFVPKVRRLIALCCFRNDHQKMLAPSLLFCGTQQRAA